MNKTIFKISLFLVLLSLSPALFSQGISISSTGTVPSPNAVLDLNTGNANNKGLIIPNVTLGTALTTFTPPIANAATSNDVGMVVYNSAATNQPIGYYYWNGTSWVTVGTGSGWSFTGNAGTTPGTNFIGTTDVTALEFKVDGQKAGWIDYNSSYANIFMGYQAGNSNAGAYNTAIGYQAFYTNTTGSQNAATGYFALYSNSTGSNNTATGYAALYKNTGSNNTAIGSSALQNNVGGYNNAAVGNAALYKNGAGNENVAMGYIALYSNTSGNYNTAIGNAALPSNSIGNSNTATGYFALYNSTGSNNTAYGYDALLTNGSGSPNTAVGYQALQLNTGNNNVAVGDNALAENSTGNDNTALGSGANVSSGGLNNTTAIGYDATATNSNSVEIGNSSVTFTGINGAAYNSSYALAVGSSTGNGNGAYLTTGGTWTNVSNRNLKENFTVPNGEEILTKISALPLFRWNYKNEPSSIQHIGPMAQDFYRIFHVGNDSLSISTIDPAGIALVGVQELNKKLEAENAALKAQITALAEKQDARISNDENQSQSIKEQQAKDEKEIAELKAMINSMNQTQAQASIK